jgi:hypothetical protein
VHLAGEGIPGDDHTPTFNLGGEGIPGEEKMQRAEVFVGESANPNFFLAFSWIVGKTNLI